MSVAAVRPGRPDQADWLHPPPDRGRSFPPATTMQPLVFPESSIESNASAGYKHTLPRAGSSGPPVGSSASPIGGLALPVERLASPVGWSNRLPQPVRVAHLLWRWGTRFRRRQWWSGPERFVPSDYPPLPRGEKGGSARARRTHRDCQKSCLRAYWPKRIPLAPPSGTAPADDRKLLPSGNRRPAACTPRQSRSIFGHEFSSRHASQASGTTRRIRNSFIHRFRRLTQMIATGREDSIRTDVFSISSAKSAQSADYSFLALLPNSWFVEQGLRPSKQPLCFLFYHRGSQMQRSGMRKATRPRSHKGTKKTRGLDVFSALRVLVSLWPYLSCLAAFRPYGVST